MNIRSIDLNLIGVLDALLDEAHVTRAAVRLGLSQSAASNALDRCRHLFGDALLERAGRGMRLTPRALLLQPQVRAVLAEVEALVSPQGVDLTTVRRTVSLITADVLSARLILPLHAALMRTSPQVSLAFRPWLNPTAALDSLARGDADLAISIASNLPADFRSRPLLDETFVVAMRKDHPAVEGFDLERWLAWPHILVSAQGDARGTLDDILEPLGLTRRIGLVVPSFALLADVLAETDFIALTASRALTPIDHLRLRVFAPPLPIPGFTLRMAWHRRRDGDTVVRHVADLIEATLAGLNPAPDAGEAQA